MNQNEELEPELETILPKKRFPKWVGLLGVLGITAILCGVFCRVFCRRRNCCDDDPCCKPSKP